MYTLYSTGKTPEFDHNVLRVKLIASASGKLDQLSVKDGITEDELKAVHQDGKSIVLHTNGPNGDEFDTEMESILLKISCPSLCLADSGDWLTLFNKKIGEIITVILVL